MGPLMHAMERQSVSQTLSPTLLLLATPAKLDTEVWLGKARLDQRRFIWQQDGATQIIEKIIIQNTKNNYDVKCDISNGIHKKSVGKATL